MDTSLIAIPPYQEVWHMSGRCLSVDTAYIIPPTGINVFASLGHMHYIGTEIWTGSPLL